MDAYFRDKVAVVTGASAGFGLGISRRLLELGAKKVWMSSHGAAALEREAEKLARQYPGKVEAVVANAMLREDVENLVARAARESGALDFLFNNAGRPMTKQTERVTVEEFESLIRLNYLGVVYGTLAALKVMLLQGGGHIVNTASCGGLLPVAYQTAYASTKAAVICMTRCMAYEYEGTGLYFSQISPMNVATSIFGAQLAEELRQAGYAEERVQKEIAKLKPPEGCMPLADALDEVFAGIRDKRVDIVFGQDGRDAYRLLCTDRAAYDALALDVRARRKAYYDAVDRGENPPFPG